jgi:hypothetical protein
MVVALIGLEEQRKGRRFWLGSLCLGRDLDPEPRHKSYPPDRKVAVIRAYFIVVLDKASIKDDILEGEYKPGNGKVLRKYTSANSRQK